MLPFSFAVVFKRHPTRMLRVGCHSRLLKLAQIPTLNLSAAISRTTTAAASRCNTPLHLARNNFLFQKVMSSAADSNKKQRVEPRCTNGAAAVTDADSKAMAEDMLKFINMSWTQFHVRATFGSIQTLAALFPVAPVPVRLLVCFLFGWQCHCNEIGLTYRLLNMI